MKQFTCCKNKHKAGTYERSPDGYQSIWSREIPLYTNGYNVTYFVVLHLNTLQKKSKIL